MSECSNHYHAPDFALTDTWTQYSFTWDQLMQPNWGPQRPFNLDRLVGLSFAHLADVPQGGTDFDLWIDDVNFI